jgi:hypothetical protein
MDAAETGEVLDANGDYSPTADEDVPVQTRYVVLSWGTRTPLHGALPADLLATSDIYDATRLPLLSDDAVRLPWYGWEPRTMAVTSQTQLLQRVKGLM